MMLSEQDIVDKLHEVEDCRKRVEDCKERLLEAKRKYKDAAEPLLTDYSLIPYLHHVFCDITGVDKLKGEKREIFVFIIIYLYAPGYFDKTPLPNGLRLSMGNVLNLNAKSVISRIKESSAHHYEHYFHDEADLIFSVMVGRLLDDGYLQKDD